MQLDLTRYRQPTTHFSKVFQPEDVGQEAQARHVRPGVRKTPDQASLDGIGDPHDHDRDGRGGLLGRLGGWCVDGHDDGQWRRLYVFSSMVDR